MNSDTAFRWAFLSRSWNSPNTAKEPFHYESHKRISRSTKSNFLGWQLSLNYSSMLLISSTCDLFITDPFITRHGILAIP